MMQNMMKLSNFLCSVTYTIARLNLLLLSIRNIRDVVARLTMRLSPSMNSPSLVIELLID